MGRNSEIKKAIKQEFKPSKPFEEFCREHNIVFEEEKPRHEEKPRRKAFSFEWIKAITATVVCIAVFLIVVPFFKGNPSLPPLRLYGDNDVYRTQMLYDEFVEEFPDNFIDYGNHKDLIAVSKVRSNIDNVVLAYCLENVLYDFEINDKLYVYEINIVIRCYEGYLFAENNFFKDLEFVYNEIVKYGIVQEDYLTAYIQFKNQNFEYFITLNDNYANITEINKTNVELFLDHLI
jgi:hypothetical protein